MDTLLLPNSTRPLIDRVPWHLLPFAPALVELLLAPTPDWVSWLEPVALMTAGYGIWFWHDY